MHVIDIFDIRNYLYSPSRDNFIESLCVSGSLIKEEDIEYINNVEEPEKEPILKWTYKTLKHER